MTDEIVTLNVGGTLFTTSKSTLMIVPFFQRMFEGNWSTTKLADGSIFIDRDPHIFGILLKILRGYTFDPDQFPDPDRSHLFEDADFYGIKCISQLNLPHIEFIEFKNRSGQWYTVPKLELVTLPLTVCSKSVNVMEKDYVILVVNLNSQPIFKRWIETIKESLPDNNTRWLEDTKDIIKFSTSKDCQIIKNNKEIQLKELTKCVAILHITNLSASKRGPVQQGVWNNSGDRDLGEPVDIRFTVNRIMVQD